MNNSNYKLKRRNYHWVMGRNDSFARNIKGCLNARYGGRYISEIEKCQVEPSDNVNIFYTKHLRSELLKVMYE